jgi:hypothetical protein
MAKIDVNIINTPVLQRILDSQASAIKRLAEGVDCLSKDDTQGAFDAMCDAITTLGASLKIAMAKKGGER